MPARTKTTTKKTTATAKGKKTPAKPNSWALAVKQARKNLNITGFEPVKKGSALYNEAKRVQGSCCS